MFVLKSNSNSLYTDFSLSISCRSAFSDNYAQSVYNHEENSPAHKRTPSQADFERISKPSLNTLQPSYFSSAGGIPWEKIETSNGENAIDERASKGENYFNEASVRRARMKLNEIITASLSARLKFITLTVDNAHLAPDFRAELRELQLFVERFSRFCASNGSRTQDANKALRYIAIPEKGEKRGRLHWHLIAVCPYVKKEILAQKIWKRGFVDIKSLRMKNADETAKQVSSYVTKYLSKGLEKWEGRTQIYYASKNWNATKKYAYISQKQGEKAFDFFKFCEKQGICSKPYISMCNFDGSKIDEFERETFIARCRLPSRLSLLPADYVSFKFRLPKKTADNFLRFCESIFVDFLDKKIMGKSKAERDTEEKIRLQNRAFRETMFDSSKIIPYVEKLKEAFPNVNAGYIYGVLKHQNKYLDQDLQINNFYLLNKFHDKIDVVNNKIPKYLKKQLTVFIKRDESVLAQTRWRFLKKLRYSDVLAQDA